MVGGGNAVAAVQVWTDGVYSVAKALKALKAELDAESKAVDKEKQKRART
jgi:IS4 transposase